MERAEGLGLGKDGSGEGERGTEELPCLGRIYCRLLFKYLIGKTLEKIQHPFSKY
jgi:hypothetical protein